MKISELESCPQWLANANTDNADVEISNGVVIWHGGVWRDGVWHGGVWRDGVWRDGVWRGEKCKNNLLNLGGLKWPITISDTRMQIGCEIHAFEDWAIFDDARINKMDKYALKFWRAYKTALLSLCSTRKA